jgi:phosphatidylserine synthase
MNFINKIQPKQLFLIDGLGALVSAIMLGIVLVMFESHFGMPKNILYWLAGLAAVFAVYSLTNYFRFGENWRLFLRIIAIVNLLYCALTAVLVVQHVQELSILGIAYFIGEMIIVITLAMIELKKANVA